MQFFSGTQADFMMSPKEEFLLAALMKQKHKSYCQDQPRKLDYNNGFVIQLTDIQYC